MCKHCARYCEYKIKKSPHILRLSGISCFSYIIQLRLFLQILPDFLSTYTVFLTFFNFCPFPSILISISSGVRKDFIFKTDFQMSGYYQETENEGQSRYRKKHPSKHTEVSDSLINLGNFKLFNMTEVETTSEILRIKT